MIGAVLRGRYELGAPLSEGPIFLAYAARDKMLLRDVCIRMLRPPFDCELSFANALQELVEKISKVHHPRLETLWEVDSHEGSPFMVSELTKGSPLAERIRKLAPF